MDLARPGELSLDLQKMESLLLDTRFLKALFALFDDDADGLLNQAEWMAKVKMNARSFEASQGERLAELMDLLDVVAFLMCEDMPINQDMFYKLLNVNGVAPKLFLVVGTVEEVSIEDFMSLVIKMTTPEDKGMQRPQ